MSQITQAIDGDLVKFSGSVPVGTTVVIETKRQLTEAQYAAKLAEYDRYIRESKLAAKSCWIAGGVGAVLTAIGVPLGWDSGALLLGIFGLAAAGVGAPVAQVWAKEAMSDKKQLIAENAGKLLPDKPREREIQATRKRAEIADRETRERVRKTWGI